MTITVTPIGIIHSPFQDIQGTALKTGSLRA
jgi:hypothetical protein